MATHPSPPGGNPPPSGNGNGNPNPSAKPRATIVLKNPNGKPGSSQSMKPATGGAPGSSQRLVPARPPLGSPSQSSRRASVQIQADREALGLSAARPSEMVEGLDEAVKRAEAMAAREEAKRKSGGKLNLNVALHVDDTGLKWKRWVQGGILVAVLAACVVGGLMLYGANHKPLDPRRALAETRAALSDLEITAKKMDRFDSGDTITPQAVKGRMQKVLEAQLDAVKKSLQRDREAGRTPDKALVTKRAEIEKLLLFKDGWEHPFEFTINGDELDIRSTTKADGVPSDPVKINLRGASSDKTGKKDK